MRLLPHSHTGIVHTLDSWHGAWTLEIAHLKWKKYVFLTRANRHFNRPRNDASSTIGHKIESDSSTSTSRLMSHSMLKYCDIGALLNYARSPRGPQQRQYCGNSYYTIHLGAGNMWILTSVKWGKKTHKQRLFISSVHAKENIFLSIWSEIGMV